MHYPLTVGVEEFPGAVAADGGHAEAVGGGTEVQHARRVALQLERPAQLVKVAGPGEHHLPDLHVGGEPWDRGQQGSVHGAESSTPSHRE